MTKILIEAGEIEGGQWQGRVLVVKQVEGGSFNHETAFRTYACRNEANALQTALCWAEDNVGNLIKWP